MPLRTVGARFKLEGEDEFNRVMQQLNAGSSTLRSEMKRLQAEYKGNTDSIEFLTDKSELLSRELTNQKEKTAAIRAMHESASQALQDAAKNYDKLSNATDTSNEELEKAKAALADAELLMEKYATKLNLAEAAEFDLQHQIDDTNEEINGQGKEMKGLGDVIGDLTQKLGVSLPQGATNALNGMNKLSTGTVAAMGVAVAGVMALVKTVKQLQNEALEAAARADNILARSAQMNISAMQYQALQYAAPFVDVDVDTMAGSLQKLTKAMGDAASGSEAAQTKFAELGVSITNTDGTLRDSYDVWLDTMDAIAGITNETERDIAAQELLGKSASELAPIYRNGTSALREYTKAAKENYVMNGEQLEALGELDDAQQKLTLDIEANKNMIGAQWAPTAKAALEAFDRLITAAGKALVDSGIITAFGNLVQLAISLLDPIASLFKSAEDAPGKLAPVEAALKAVAYVLATIQDTINVIRGLLPWNWGSGLARTALGWNTSQGQLSAIGKLQYGDPSTYGWVYDENAGGWIGNGWNATGNDNWRGGLTYVGEAGPELVALPRGSQILNAQDTRNAGGTTNYYINVNDVEELEQVLNWFQSRQVAERMR